MALSDNHANGVAFIVLSRGAGKKRAVLYSPRIIFGEKSAHEFRSRGSRVTRCIFHWARSNKAPFFVRAPGQAPAFFFSSP